MEEISCSERNKLSEFCTQTLIDSTGGLSVAVERCPLCSESKRPFYCQKCVSNGKFIHTNAKFPDSYDSLHRKWEMTRKERDHVLERFKEETAQIQARYQKRAVIDQCKRNIELLKKSLMATKQMIAAGKAKQENQRRENHKRYHKGKKHEQKKQWIKDYIAKATDRVSGKQEAFTNKQKELMELRQKHISDLITYIFPVSEVKSKGDSMTMGASDDVREALQEASQTAYVRGRWIYSSSQYRIVEPTLPSHGEYSQYNLMVARSSEDGSHDTTVSPGNPGNSIIAGLCYTSQLLAVLSDILNVGLPKRQCYSDFCVSDLPEKQFNSVVARLNKNVLYLCFSQGVDTENIEPKHTLYNVLLLLKHHKLGRIGSFDVMQDMLDSVEDSNGHSEESDDDVIAGHDEPDSTEWERVPENIPVPMPAEESTMQNIGYVSQDMTDSTLSASGVISSAYNTVSSFFSFRR